MKPDLLFDGTPSGTINDAKSLGVMFGIRCESAVGKVQEDRGE